MAFESSVLARFGVRQAPPGSMVVDEVEGDEASVDGGRGDQSVIADAADGPGEAGATTLEVTEFPRAQAMVLRCLRFPLYPSLTSKEVAEIERVLTTLP